MISALLVSLIVGSWGCNDSQIPGAKFDLSFFSNGIGVKVQSPAHDTSPQRFTYHKEIDYLIEQSDGGSLRYLAHLKGDSLELLSRGYWHENRWTPMPLAGTLTCVRLVKAHYNNR